MEEPTSRIRITRLIPFEGEGAIKAYCDVALDERFLVRGVRVVSGARGLFVSMPRQHGKDGEWFDIVLALTTAAKAEVERAVLEAYRHALTQDRPPSAVSRAAK